MIHFELDDLPPNLRAQVLRQQGSKPAEIKEKPSQSKYKNIKDSRPAAKGPITFASIKEAARYDELLLMQKAGLISDLRLQPQFTLQESYVTPDGERIRGMRYTADFSYTDSNGEYVVEDVKTRPTRTEQYKMRKKMMANLKHINIKEI